MSPATKAAISVVAKKIASSRVLALRQVIPDYQSQGPLWGRAMQVAHANQIHTANDTACFAIFHDKGFKPTDVDTEVCVPVSQDIKPTAIEGFTVYDTPEISRAACATHKGSYEGLSQVYNELFGWIGTRGEIVSGPVREIYHGVEEKTELVTEIVVPLQEK